MSKAPLALSIFAVILALVSLYLGIREHWAKPPMSAGFPASTTSTLVQPADIVTLPEIPTTHARAYPVQGQWSPMSTAPRDGTVIEIMNNYGVAPTYGLYRWTKEETYVNLFGKTGETITKRGTGRWASVDKPGHGFGVAENYFSWRPYDIAAFNNSGRYNDPTNGAQDTIKYWCDAMHVGYDSKKDACVQ